MFPPLELLNPRTSVSEEDNLYPTKSSPNSTYTKTQDFDNTLSPIKKNIPQISIPLSSSETV